MQREVNVKDHSGNNMKHPKSFSGKFRKIGQLRNFDEEKCRHREEYEQCDLATPCEVAVSEPWSAFRDEISKERTEEKNQPGENHRQIA